MECVLDVGKPMRLETISHTVAPNTAARIITNTVPVSFAENTDNEKSYP